MSSSDEDEFFLLALALLEEEQYQQPKRRRCQKSRDSDDEDTVERSTAFQTIVDLRNDPKAFYSHFGLMPECFDEILELIQDDIRKKEAYGRASITTEERLAIALRFLVAGESYSRVSRIFKVGATTVSSIISDVCSAICSRMQPLYMPEPTTEMWKTSADEFYEKWQFPNCIGCVDNKFVSVYNIEFGYDKRETRRYSVVLVAIVGADNRFIWVDIDRYGETGDSNDATSDGRIFENSLTCKRLASETKFNIPYNQPLPERTKAVPYVLLGDGSFVSKVNLMKPLLLKDPNDQFQNPFNEYFFRARSVVKNAFALLAKKFRIYDKPMELKFESVKKIIQTTCILHNYLNGKHCDDVYLEHIEDSQQEIKALVEMPHVYSKTPRSISRIRDEFVDYFFKREMNIGFVSSSN